MTTEVQGIEECHNGGNGSADIFSGTRKMW